MLNRSSLNASNHTDKICSSITGPLVNYYLRTPRPRSQRLIVSQNGSLLIVFNDQTTDQTVKIEVPARFKTAVNIYDNQSQNIQSGAIEIKVP